jgi:hypothetical protein
MLAGDGGDFAWAVDLPVPEVKLVLSPDEARSALEAPRPRPLPGQLISPTGEPLAAPEKAPPNPTLCAMVQKGIHGAFVELWGGVNAPRRFRDAFWWLTRPRSLTVVGTGGKLFHKGEPPREHQSSLVLPGDVGAAGGS